MLRPAASSRRMTSPPSPSIARLMDMPSHSVHFTGRNQGSKAYEIARQRQQVTIANSDAASNAYLHTAIDQASQPSKTLTVYEHRFRNRFPVHCFSSSSSTAASFSITPSVPSRR